MNDDYKTKRQFVVNINPDLAGDLRNYCILNGVSMSRFVSMLIGMFLTNRIKFDKSSIK